MGPSSLLFIRCPSENAVNAVIWNSLIGHLGNGAESALVLRAHLDYPQDTLLPFECYPYYPKSLLTRIRVLVPGPVDSVCDYLSSIAGTVCAIDIDTWIRDCPSLSRINNIVLSLLARLKSLDNAGLQILVCSCLNESDILDRVQVHLQVRSRETVHGHPCTVMSMV